MSNNNGTARKTLARLVVTASAAATVSLLALPGMASAATPHNAHVTTHKVVQVRIGTAVSYTRLPNGTVQVH